MRKAVYKVKAGEKKDSPKHGIFYQAYLVEGDQLLCEDENWGPITYVKKYCCFHLAHPTTSNLISRGCLEVFVCTVREFDREIYIYTGNNAKPMSLDRFIMTVAYKSGLSILNLFFNVMFA
jgi:hypothetical protein